jgi:hypothetical protein
MRYLNVVVRSIAANAAKPAASTGHPGRFTLPQPEKSAIE